MDDTTEIGSIGVNTKKNTLTRRDFLKLAGLFGLSAASAAIGIDKFDIAKEKFAQASLSSKLSSGTFSAENFQDLLDMSELKNKIKSKTESMSGISGSGLYISYNDEIGHLGLGEYSGKFSPGSLIKIPLLYQVWLQGQKDGVDYLTPEIAQKILRESHSSKEFIMSLPFVKDKNDEGVNSVIVDLLKESRIYPNVNQDGGIEIDMLDYFRFLRQTEFPPVILNAMKQTSEDDANNYGISSILRKNYEGHDSVFFKIGLEEKNNELFNSYVMMIGDNIKLVGYSKGKNYEQVHEQMLMTGAALASYASGKTNSEP